MATRPVSSRGGLTGAHYGMIAFAILTVIALALFNLMLTQVKGLREQADRSQRQLRDYGSPPAYYAQEARARRSNAFGVMADDLRKVASLVSGNPDDVGRSLEAKAQRILDRIAADNPGTINPGDTLLTALERMEKQYQEARDGLEALDLVNEDLQAQVATLTDQLKAQEDQFTAQVDALSKQLEQVRTEMAAMLEQKDEQVRETQSALDASEAQVQNLRQRNTQELRQLQIEKDALVSQIANLQQEIREFKTSFDPMAILTKADGRILRAIPGSEVVYVNLGASEEVKPGMGFEVFSQTGEVPEGLSGKASLEVVTVMEDTSECRVTRRAPGKPIIEGDIVVNIAFERGRKPRFVIRGEFDLNYDGQADFDGVEQVMAMIREWGGQVVDELDETVDFVVIGLPPTIPTFARTADISPVVREQQMKKQLELSEYRALVDRAWKMYIPVITQSPFLYLMGYPGSGMVAAR